MGDQDWSRWLETPPAAAEPGTKAPVVRLRLGKGSAAPSRRPILVIGGCGGAGTTTTALGIAGELAAGGTGTVAVDATPAGGDLALRGADEHLHPISLQSWLYGRGADEPAPLKECMSRSTSGAGILWRDSGPLRRRASYLTVGKAVTDAGFTPIYDGGSPIAARQIRPLLEDSTIAVVLVIPARVDAANRLRLTLEWLDDELGDPEDTRGAGVVSETTILVSHQLPDAEPDVADHLRSHLGGWVRDVMEIPYDPHLARGELVSHNALSPRTRDAYKRLIFGVV
jgi:MinD-like ATPase involved in chromosome partitioning or flagellar assembly